MTETMENPRASKRVRLTAAIRLDDLLRRQERREDAEVRRAERVAAQAARERAEALEREQQATPEDMTAREVEQQREAAHRRGVEHLKKVLDSPGVM